MPGTQNPEPEGYYSASKLRVVPFAEMRAAHVLNAIGKLRRQIAAGDASYDDEKLLNRLLSEAERRKITEENTPKRGTGGSDE